MVHWKRVYKNYRPNKKIFFNKLFSLGVLFVLVLSNFINIISKR